MNKTFLKTLLPVALAVCAAAPATAQVRVEVGVGPFDIRFAPDPPPPPPVHPEFRTPPPGRDFIWIDGYWDRVGDRWEWCKGRWDRPGRRDARWVAPVYRRDGGGYRYEPGHWSNQRVVEGEAYRRMRNDPRYGHRQP
jgi:hypothetical protein